jgi:hypothetical protein
VFPYASYYGVWAPPHGGAERLRITREVGSVLGNGRDQLSVDANGYYDDAGDYHWGLRFLDGLGTSPGRHFYRDFVAGTIWDVGYQDHQEYAGDVNGDGIGDLWLSTLLFLGPIRGDKTEDDAVTWFTGYDAMVGGNFDANADGFVDVGMFYGGTSFAVYYGPFAAGALPVMGDPGWETEVSHSELPDCHGERGGWIIPGLDGPGSIVVVAGGQDGYIDCASSPTMYVNISGPPGQVWTEEHGLLGVSKGMWAFDVGDWDGDGHVDFVQTNNLKPGPLAYDIDEMPAMFVGGTVKVARTLDDMNGDSVRELLIFSDLDLRWYVLLSGTVGREEITQADLPSIATWIDTDPLEWELLVLGLDNYAVTGDFDGDGKGDLVMSSAYANDDGGMAWIWRGADISP